MPKKQISNPKPADSPEQAEGLSHLTTGSSGDAEACMVDVGDKSVTDRTALASALILFPDGVLASIEAEGGPKGSMSALLEVARVAGIMAAKRTGDLIPMCHPLGLDHVEITFLREAPNELEVRCSAACRGKTGIEMEAMTGASLAALTVYDMTKALTKGIRIEAVRLLEKRGGKSGVWRAADYRG
jgi:cyclic pyranopterin phosphate synthase